MVIASAPEPIRKFLPIAVSVCLFVIFRHSKRATGLGRGSSLAFPLKSRTLLRYSSTTECVRTRMAILPKLRKSDGPGGGLRSQVALWRITSSTAIISGA